MSHPTEHLADYVDGTLSPELRADVDAHLPSCDACRGEVARATAARDALRRLPEIQAPMGIPERVRREAEADRPSKGEATSGARVYKILGGLVAAALVGIFAISVITRGGMSSSPTSIDSVSGAGAAAEAPEATSDSSDQPGGRDTDGDYTGEELQELADRAVEAGHKAGDDLYAAGDTLTTAGTRFSKWEEQRVVAGYKSSGSRGARCLRTAGAFESGGILLQAFDAKLAGIPATFGIILTGDAPGDAADRIVIWVAQKQGCDVIGFAQSYIVRPSPSPFPEELEGITPPPGL